MTYDDFSNLTAGQRAKLDQFRAIGLALEERQNVGGPAVDISMVNDAQAKNATTFLRDVAALNGPTEQGIRYVRQFYKDQAAKAYEDSVPG